MEKKPFKLIQNPVLRNTIFIFGLITTALGFLGLFLPLLPTTPFLILSAWCFLRSSAKAHNWLYNQPFLGEVLIDWEEKQAISIKAKLLSISMILASFVLIWIRVDSLPVKIGTSVILATTTVFILTRKNN